MSPVEALAVRQLAAYNAADLDSFCACYHPEVRVLRADEVAFEGIEAFRAHYAASFAAGAFGATVSTRLVLGDHCIDDESYWAERAAGRVEGRVLVRYTLRDDRIGVVQFLR